MDSIKLYEIYQRTSVVKRIHSSNMKFLIVFAVAVAVASAQYRRPSSSDQGANIVRYDSDISPDGSYRFSYETDNGIAAQEQGSPAQGSFSYTSPEGVPVSISYVADENGFQPTGNVLPVAPPVPPQIQRALEWIARNPSRQ